MLAHSYYLFSAGARSASGIVDSALNTAQSVVKQRLSGKKTGGGGGGGGSGKQV